MNLREEIARLIEEGYSQANVRARLCQVMKPGIITHELCYITFEYLLGVY